MSRTARNLVAACENHTARKIMYTSSMCERAGRIHVLSAYKRGAIPMLNSTATTQNTHSGS